MAIISASKRPKFRRYGKTQFRYAMAYVAITFVVLVFLNLYCSATNQKLFYQSKQTAMLEKAQLAANEIAGLELLTPASAAAAAAQMDSLKVTRLLITDQSGVIVYDSLNNTGNLGRYALLPQIVQAVTGNDVFTWHYRNGVMRSEAAIPVVSYGVVTGCVYMLEYDTEQGALLQTLHSNILIITIVLELVLLIFALIFSHSFSQRLRKIMVSLRIIQKGDFSHKVHMDGNDELTVLAEEFNDLTDRLQVSENKRRQFVSDASHELKTPLASIKLLTDSILQNDMDRETLREFVSDIGNEAERLNRMSQKLLSLTRGEAVPDEENEIVPMAPTVERVAMMLSAQAKASGIEIVTDLEEDVPILIRQDDLYQIVFNLVENAIKYNVPGGKVTVTLSRRDDWGVIRVADTGMGIPEDSLSHIFERFYRVDKARARATGGSGLGLSIVRAIVQRNNGEIRVESTLGQGTQFTVEFTAFDTEEEPN